MPLGKLKSTTSDNTDGGVNLAPRRRLQGCPQESAFSGITYPTFAQDAQVPILHELGALTPELPQLPRNRVFFAGEAPANEEAALGRAIFKLARG